MTYMGSRYAGIKALGTESLAAFILCQGIPHTGGFMMVTDATHTYEKS